jgi:hypothetical protein
LLIDGVNLKTVQKLAVGFGTKWLQIGYHRQKALQGQED